MLLHAFTVNIYLDLVLWGYMMFELSFANCELCRCVVTGLGGSLNLNPSRLSYWVLDTF